MKISKEELVYLLDLTGAVFTPANIQFRGKAVANELKDGTLEIEGYEQSTRWIKFDVHDTSTYPVRNPGQDVLIRCDDGFIRSFPTEFFYKAFTAKNKITHWREMPKFTEDAK